MKPFNKNSSGKLFSSVLAIAASLALPTAQAATNTWNGAGVGANTGSLWDVAASYNPSATFSSANDIDFSTITNPGSSLTLSAGSAGSVDVNNLNFGTAGSALANTERLNFNGNGTPGATTLNLTGGIVLPRFTGSVVILGSDLTLNLSNAAHSVTSATGTSVLIVNSLVTGGGAAASFTNTSTTAPMVMTNNNNSFINAGSSGVRYNGYLGFTSVGNVGSGNSSLGNATTAANGLLWMSNGSALDYIGIGNQSTDRALQLDGTVSFNNSSAGTTLTYNGAATFNGVSGSEIRSAVVGGSSLVFNTVISGSYGVRTQSATSYNTDGTTATNNGQGTLILNGNNTFSGTVNANVGTLQIGHVNALGTTAGATSIASGATLDLNGITGVAENISSLNGNGNGGIGALINSNISTSASLTGTVVIASHSSVGGAGDLALTGVISGTSRNLTKIGTGTLTLSGTNTYTGTTAVNQGTLTLDFGNAGAPATNIIISNAANILTMGGGTLNLTGKANTTNSQVFASTTLNSGASAFTINNSATANPDSLTLGAITRNVGSTVTFNQPANGTVGATNGYVTTSGTASTILTDSGVAYATVGLNDWAAQAAGKTNIVGLSTLSGYTANSGTTLAGNADMSAGNTTLSAASTITSLRFNTAAADTTVTATGQTLTTGGILIGSTVGSNNTFITGGTLKGGVSKDLTIIQNSTGTLTISSVIANNTSATGLTKSGTGALTLTGVNTYTGTTTVNGGTLTASGSGTFGSVNSGLTVNTGSTVDLNGTSQGVGVLAGTGGTILNNATGTNMTLTIGNNNATGGSYVGVIANNTSGTGTIALTKTGTGIQTLTGANTYTGVTTINGGTLQSSNSGALGTTSAVAVNNSGSMLAVNYGGGLEYTQAQVGALLAKTTFGSTSTAFALDTTNGSSLGTIYSNALTMAAGLTKLGTNSLILTGANTYTGATTINAGTLQSANSGVLSTTSAVAVNNSGSTLAVNYGGSFDYTQAQVGTLLGKTTFGATSTALGFDTTNGSGTYGTALTMSAGLTKLGANTLTLTGTNTYTGTTTISAGILQLGNGGTTGKLATTGAITMAVNSSLTINRSDAVTQGTDFSSAALTGQGGFTQAGAGTTTLNAINTYTGATTINAGTLVISGSPTGVSATALNAGKLKLDYSTNNTSKIGDTAVLTLTGGTLELSGGSHTEAVASTTIQTGSTFIKQTSGASKLAMGAITSTSGAIDFGAANIATTSTANTNGILNQRATVAGTDFAANDGSNNIVAYTGYTAYVNATLANTNYSLAGSGGGAVTASSSTLKITTTGSGQSFAAGTNSFSNGAILFAGADDYAITTSGAGKITTTSLLNYGAGTLSLGALGGNFTQFGTGKTLLTTASTTENTLTVNGGSLQFSNNLQLGPNNAVRAITLNNGKLVADTTGGNIALDNAGTLSRTVTIGAGGGTIDVIGGNTLTVSGVISGSAPVTFTSTTGNGTNNLTATNTYTGATVVSSGTLLISGSGTVNTTSGISVNGGTLNYQNNATGLSANVTLTGGTFKNNSTQNYTGTLTFTSGTVGGTNLSGVALAIGSGQTISPGNSPDTLTTGAETWTGGGSYVWEINNATGSQGTNWDFISGSGVLDISSLTSLSKFNIDVIGLTAGNVSGAVPNWSNTNQSWKIASFSSITGSFASNLFNVDASGFTNNNTAPGTFSVSNIGNDLYVSYAVPEPATWALLAFSLTTVTILRRRRS